MTDKDPSKIEIPVVYMNITIPFAGLIKQGVDAVAEEFGVNACMTGATACMVQAGPNFWRPYSGCTGLTAAKYTHQAGK